MDCKALNKLKIREGNISKIGSKIYKISGDVINRNVSQHAAYWNVRQKLDQEKANYKRQLDHMVELQTQNETVSGLYQEESQLHSEVLNKVQAIQEMCDELEAGIKRLKQTVLRTKADQKTLNGAFQDGALTVQDTKDSYRRAEEKNLDQISCLQEKAKLAEEHHACEIEVNIGISQQSIEKLQVELNDAGSKLANAYSQYAKKEEDFKQDKINMIRGFENELESAKTAIQALEKSLKEAVDANAKIKNHLNNQEECYKRLLNEINELHENIAILEEEKMIASAQIETLNQESKRVRDSFENVNNYIIDLNTRVEEVRKQLQDKDDVVNQLTSEAEEFRRELSTIEGEKEDLIEALKKREEERDISRQRIDELLDEAAASRAAVDDKTAEHDNYKLSTDILIRELNTTVQHQSEGLNKGEKIAAQIRTDLKTSTARVDSLQRNVQQMTQQLEEERKKATNKLNEIQQLEADFEEQNSAQPPKSLSFLEPADDNALFTPIGEVRGASPITPSAAQDCQQLADKLYEMRSDSSSNEKAIDINFLAWRKRLEKQPTPQLKRRGSKRQTPAQPEEQPRAPRTALLRSKRYDVIPKRK